MSDLSDRFAWAVNAVLYRDDLLGLARMGAPADEYISEARDIVRALLDPEDTRPLEQVLRETYYKWFNGQTDPHPSPAWDMLANEVAEAIQVAIVKDTRVLESRTADLIAQAEAALRRG